MNSNCKGGALVEAAICIPLLVIIIFTSFNFIPAIIQLNVIMNSSKASARVANFDCSSANPESIFSSVKEKNNIIKNDATWSNSGTTEILTSYGDLSITVTSFQSNKNQGYCILCSEYFGKPNSTLDINSLFPKPRGC